MSTTVPAGLALYWFMSNLSGVVFQYFYMGRTVDWRSLLTMNPAPAPAAKARNGRAERQRSKPAKEIPESESSADLDSEGRPADGSAGPQARRKRNGRRRGKR
jgi:hypothetical protein